jgi:hypothetical protein
MKPIPKLSIETRPFISPYLTGWEDLNHWARCNHSLWRAVIERIEHTLVLSEVDTLKILAASLLEQNVELMDKMLEMARIGMPAPIIHVHPPK